MSLWGCGAVRANLQALHDGELDVPETIAFEGHLDSCSRCAGEMRRLRVLGEALRAAGVESTPPDGLAGLVPGVISRMTAEREEALPARLRRLFGDMHLVWAGLGATAATLTCGLLITGMLYFASSAQHDSMAGLIAALAKPGSNENPVRLASHIRAPQMVDESLMPEMFARSMRDGDAHFTLVAVVTQEGRLIHLEIVQADPWTRLAMVDLLDAAALARFEPARVGGTPVAVNLVWLLAHTTVRGKLHL
jgi:hypothetical protein